ncbi:MAG: Mth938-like domain-containing protein [Candidatus Bathyarchaeia archaeon]
MRSINSSELGRMGLTINSYSFGRIVIGGSRYTSDVIVYPDRVEDGWWRKEGHQLCADDIREAVEGGKPEVLIVGTGYMGLMRVLPEARGYLKSQGVELLIERTKRACEVFNQLSGSRRVMAALHLTC